VVDLESGTARPRRSAIAARLRAAPARALFLLLALSPAPAAAWDFFSREWMESEGIPVHEGFAIADVNELKLKPWKRLGASGAYISLYGHEGLANAYVLEIAPGRRTLRERHVFEEYLYVLSGSGETVIQQPGRAEQVVAWQAGSLVTPPLNTLHEHLNRGNTPAKLVGFTNAPPILDFYRDAEFVFDNPHAFRSRYDGEADFFTRRGEAKDGAHLEMNFIENVHGLGEFLRLWKKKRARVVGLAMAGNVLSPHVSEWDPESFQSAHRHGAGANVMILEGSGFAMMWPREAGRHPYTDGNGDRVVKVDFRKGSLYVPPRDWYHTHFNTGAEKAVYLAFTGQGRRHRVQATATVLQTHPEIRRALEGLPLEETHPEFIRKGDEDPLIREMFEDAVRRARKRAAQR